MALQWTPLLIEWLRSVPSRLIHSVKENKWRRNHTSGVIRTVRNIFDAIINDERTMRRSLCLRVYGWRIGRRYASQVRIRRAGDDTSLPEVLERVTHKEVVWINKVKQTAKSNREGEPIFPRATYTRRQIRALVAPLTPPAPPYTTHPPREKYTR